MGVHPPQPQSSRGIIDKATRKSGSSPKRARSEGRCRVSDHEGVSALGRETQLPADIDVFELAAVGMVITDSTGCFCRVNPAFSRLFGRGRDELVGTSFNSLTSPDDVARSNAVMRDLLTKVVDTVQFEKRYL